MSSERVDINNIGHVPHLLAAVPPLAFTTAKYPETALGKLGRVNLRLQYGHQVFRDHNGRFDRRSGNFTTATPLSVWLC